MSGRVNQPLIPSGTPELGHEFEFDFDDIGDIDPLEIVLFRFLESDTGDDSFETRIALLVRLLEQYDETDDTFLPPAKKLIPAAESRELGARMRELKAHPGGRVAPRAPEQRDSRSLFEILRRAVQTVGQSSWR